MLELRPNCEFCDRDLPPDAGEARICAYECTFCVSCVESVLENVCPNCGGGFEKRPIRPKTDRRSGVSLVYQPSSNKRVHTNYSREEILEFSEAVKTIEPSNR